MKKLLLTSIIIMCVALASCASPTVEPETLYHQIQPLHPPEFTLPEISPPPEFKLPDAIPLNSKRIQEHIDHAEKRGEAWLLITVDYHTYLKDFHAEMRRYIKDVRARDEAYGNYYMSLSEWEEQMNEQEFYIPCPADIDSNIPTEDCQ